MTVPVFDFATNTYIGENVVLDQEIFNQTIRRDIIHKVFLFNEAYNRRTHKLVKSKGLVSGSNRKPFRQKKTGRAPQGDIRAPNLYHGGHAFGARPRNYYFPLNKKIRLFGLQSILTSKFLENKIIVINSEKLDFNTERVLEKSVKFLRENRTLLITSTSPCEIFTKEVEKINFVKPIVPNKINVAEILRNQYIVFTKQGLADFVELIKERKINYFRNRKVPLNPAEAKVKLENEAYKFDFDPNKTLVFHTPALKGSAAEIEAHFKEPEIRIKQIMEKREKLKLEKEKLKEENRAKIAENLYSDDTALEKRRLQLKKERRMKALKETRRLALKKKKTDSQAKVAEKGKK